jgi:hypothetical protein
MATSYADLMAKMRQNAPDHAAARTRSSSAPTSGAVSAPVLYADDKRKRKRRVKKKRLTKARARENLGETRTRSRRRRAKETSRRKMAKATPAQLRALRKARAAKRRYGMEAPGKKRKRPGAKRHKVRGHRRKGTRVKAHMSYEESRRRRRRYRRRARETVAEAPRRRRRARRGSPRRRSYRRRRRAREFAGEARRRHRRRRPRAREYAFEARRHRRRGRRRYRGALENPLSGVELAITLLTGSVGFMGAELADRYMARREGAPNVTLVVNGAKAPQLAMYHDWPRLIVAGAVTAAPLGLSMFVTGPVWRSALQTMGIGAGLRSIGNILIGLAAQLTLDAKKESWKDPKNIFAFEQSLTQSYEDWAKAEADKKKGTEGLPGKQGTGALEGSCPRCGRKDGLGACCRSYGFQPQDFPGTTQPSQPLPPPPPIVTEQQTPPPPPSMTPPVARVPPPARERNGGGGGGGEQPETPVPPPQISQPSQPLPHNGGGGGYTPPGITAGPVSSSMLSQPILRGIPRGAGVGAIVPRPQWDWGAKEDRED